MSYKDNDNCQFCDRKFHLADDGTCEKIELERCSELDKDDTEKCYSCEEGILVKDNECHVENKC